MVNTLSVVPAVFGSTTTFWVICLVAGIVVFGIIGILIILGYQSRQVFFMVTNKGLSIGSGHYGKFIPREDILTDGVKVVNLKKESVFRPKSKTDGSTFPGFSSGWYRLANEEAALVFVTKRSKVVYIPTNKEYSVLLSIREAEEFADDLHSWAPA
jgi:hypothetical protein